MTNAERRKYSKDFSKMLDLMEERFIGKVYGSLKSQVNVFAGVLRSHGTDAARYHVSSDLLNEQVYPALKRLYTVAGLMNATKIRSELRLEQQKRFGRNAEMEQMILDYLNKHLLERSVVPISETTREWVLRVIDKGIEEGKGAAEIARELIGSRFLRFQAERIVRTETVRASNVGAVMAAQTSPFVVVKEWIAAHDNRTRHSHRFVDGQVAEMGERFSNGLMQPGDPEGPAEEVINCRCTVAIVPKRDENGRLIRTQNRNLFALI